MGKEFHLKGLTLFGRPGRSPALEVVFLRGNTTHHTGLQEQRPRNSKFARGGIFLKKGGCSTQMWVVFIRCRSNRQETHRGAENHADFDAELALMAVPSRSARIHSSGKHSNADAVLISQSGGFQGLPKMLFNSSKKKELNSEEKF